MKKSKLEHADVKAAWMACTAETRDRETRVLGKTRALARASAGLPSHTARAFYGTMPRTEIPSGPFEPARPWSLPGPRNMSEGWVPSPLGTVHGWPPGPLPRLVIPSPGIASGEQRLVLASERLVSPHMATTTGSTMTTLSRERVSDTSSRDRRSLVGYLQEPQPSRPQDADLFEDPHSAGPRSSGKRNAASCDGFR